MNEFNEFAELRSGVEKTHKMFLPQKVIVGENIIERLREVCEELAEKERIAVITGRRVYGVVGEKLKSNWEASQRVRVIFAGAAVMSEVNRLIHLIREFKCELILAVGGGRVIDLAKATAFKTNVEFYSIPTTASHDGIASQLASIRGGGRVCSFMAKPPKAIVVDVEVIREAPKRLISSGVGDALAKITAVRDWKLAHIRLGEYFGEYSAQLALMGAKLVMRKAAGIGRGDKNSIRTLVEALISDGVAAGIAGSSRPCSGSEHLFSHALDMYSTQHALHGEQCGVGTIIMAYLHGLPHYRIVKALKSAGAPTNSNELGISEENIIKALTHAREIRPERYTILNEVKLDEKKAFEIAKETGVI